MTVMDVQAAGGLDAAWPPRTRGAAHQAGARADEEEAAQEAGHHQEAGPPSGSVVEATRQLDVDGKDVVICSKRVGRLEAKLSAR